MVPVAVADGEQDHQDDHEQQDEVVEGEAAEQDGQEEKKQNEIHGWIVAWRRAGGAAPLHRQTWHVDALVLVVVPIPRYQYYKNIRSYDLGLLL